MEVELAVPRDCTMDQIRNAEDIVRQGIGSRVRGVRRVRIKYVTKGQEAMDFADEFIGAGISPRSSPEPEDEGNHHEHHGRDREDLSPPSTGDRRRR